MVFKYFLQTLFLTISKIKAKLKYLLDSGLLPSMFTVIEVTFQNRTIDWLWVQYFKYNE